MLDLRIFDLSYGAREDTSNYEEGITTEGAIVRGIYENTWLTPGITFNDTYVKNNGAYYVKVLGQFLADSTALCADSAADGYQGTTLVPVAIDSKSSTVIDGCFTSKGIVDASEVAILKNEAGRALATEWQNQVEAMITAEGTAFNYTEELYTNNPRQLLINARTQYKQTNKVMPTTAIISYEYEGDLISSFANGATFTPAKNEEALVKGTVGVLFGMLITPSDISEPFYIFDKDVLHIPIAKDTASDLISNDNYGGYSDMVGPIQVMQSTNAAAGTKKTYIHLNYGKKIVSPRQFLVATLEVVTPPVAQKKVIKEEKEVIKEEKEVIKEEK